MVQISFSSGKGGSLLVKIAPYVGFVVGGFLLFKGFQWFKLKRLIEDIPTSKIRSIAMGLVEIAGRALPYKDDILVSPITKQKCLFYLFIVEGYIERMDKRRRYKAWEIVGTGSKYVPHFCLEDETGKVLVKTEKAKGLDRARSISESDYKYDLPRENLAEMEFPIAALKSIFDTKLAMAEKLRYYELIVRPGDTLYIMGTAGDNPLVEEGTAQQGVEDIMMHKGKYEKAFYISEKQERGVVKKLQRDSILGIGIGAAFMIISFTIILIKWGLF